MYVGANIRCNCYCCDLCAAERVAAALLHRGKCMVSLPVLLDCVRLGQITLRGTSQKERKRQFEAFWGNECVVIHFRVGAQVTQNDQARLASLEAKRTQLSLQFPPR